MSYESRRKKRAHKRAAVKSRRTGDAVGSWWFTLAKRSGRFGCCGRWFERGDKIVYRHEPCEIRCIGCADRDPESKGYRPSIRWERKNWVRKAA